MKILLINKYWRHAGGVEVHQFQVAEWLESRGHTVIPFAMDEPETIDNPYRSYFPSHVELRGGSVAESARGLMRATFSRDSRRSLRKLIEQERPDAAYVLHVYHQLGTALLNELHERGIPTVLSIHDYKIGCPNYRLYSESAGAMCMSCLGGERSYLTAPAKQKCWGGSSAAGVALTLEAAATKARRSYLKPQVVTYLNAIQRQAALLAGVEEERLHLVPHPVELSSTRPLPSATAPFLYLGRLVPEKGVDVLIKAAAEAGVALEIAGDGRSRSDLERLAESLNARVAFIGAVDRDRVPDLMRASRALVVPSTWHEVSPLVVYEAIANDVPVIASAVGGITDQLGGGRGYLVPPGDVSALAVKLREVVADSLAAQRTSSMARSFATDNWSRNAWIHNMTAAFDAAGVAL